MSHFKTFTLAIFLGLFLGCATGSKNEGRKLTTTEEALLQVSTANGYLQAKQFPQALAALEEAEKIDDDVPEIYHVRALVYFYRDQLSQAIAEEKKALKLKSNFTEANNTLGKFLTDSNQLDEAIPYLEKAAQDEIYQERYKPLTNLGIVYYRKGMYSKSGELFNQAIKESSSLACVAYYYRGHLNLLANKVNSAIDDYSMASKNFCTSFVEAHFAQATALTRSKKYEQARKKFLEIHDSFPESPLAQKAMDELRKLP